MAKNNLYRIATLETLLANRTAKAATNGYVSRFLDVAKQIVSSAQHLRDLDAKKDPDESEFGHNKRIASAAQRVGRKVTDLEEDLLELYAEAKSGIDSEIDSKVNLRPNSKYEAEIRAVFRSLPLAQQTAMLKSFVDSNDGPSLAAICCCPAVLSGVSAEMQDRFKAHMLNKNAPAQVGQSKELFEAMRCVLQMANVARDYTTDFAPPVVLDADKAAAVERGSKAQSLHLSH